jgi:hypothetical protein
LRARIHRLLLRFTQVPVQIAVCVGEALGDQRATLSKHKFSSGRRAHEAGDADQLVYFTWRGSFWLADDDL